MPYIYPLKLLTKQILIPINLLTFMGAAGYTPLGFPCPQPVAVTDFSSAALPFVITAYPVI